jgi:HSP20 family molecular chaperone IbpA
MAENSFFKKIKKGMMVEEEAEKAESSEIKEIPIELEVEEEEKKPKAKRVIKKERVTLKTEDDSKEESATKKKLSKGDGQLAVDVYQTDSELVIQSAIAGIKPEDLDIAVEGDLITIKGERRRPFGEDGDYFSQECYWGQFSRQIILPIEVDPGRIDASLREGILTIKMPKIIRERKRKITVKRL